MPATRYLRCLSIVIMVQIIVGLILVTILLFKSTATERTLIIRKEEVRKIEPLTSQAYNGSTIPPLGKASVSDVQGIFKQTVSDSQGISKKTKPDLSGEEPIRILQWTSSNRNEGFVKKCDVPCFHTTDRSDATMSTVGAVVFDIPSYGAGNPRSALKGKASQALTVGLSMESSNYYTRQKDLSDYDLTITCSFDSDLPVTYYGWNYNLLLNVSDSPWEKREPAIVFIAKNCHSRNRRESLVKRLQQYVRVDSVSSCLNNRPWPPEIPRSNKDAVQKRYLMYLAAENSIEKDYVTEKVYGGLINGAVPFYLGAPNIQEFVPTHSVIPIPGNFTEKDIVRIADIAKAIIANKKVYEEWIEFKKHPYEERFKRKFSVANTHIWCRLCRKLYALKHGLRWDRELQEIIFD